MTQGIFINGSRPKSKKEIKEYVKGIYEPNDGPEQDTPPNDLYGLVIEATSLHGNEFDGSLAKAERSLNDPGYNSPMEGTMFPRQQGITFVGPDPYSKRNFYGQIKWNEQKGRFVVS